MAAPVRQERLFLYNTYVPGKASHCAMNGEQAQRVQEAYNGLKNLVAPNAIIFEINFSKMLVIYEADDRSDHMRDLQHLIKLNEAHKQHYEILLAAIQPAWSAPLRAGSVEAMRKTTSSHPIPLQRRTVVHQELATQYSDSAASALHLYASSQKSDGSHPTPEEQEAALRRMVAVEHILQSHKPQLALLKTEAAQDPGRKRELERQIALLEKIECDRLAVYMAVAFYPVEVSALPTATGRIAAVTAAADALKVQLEEMTEWYRQRHNASNYTSMNRIKAFFTWSALPAVVEEDKTYAADVAALLFSMLAPPEARMGYLEFCRCHNIPPKADYHQGESLLSLMSGIMAATPLEDEAGPALPQNALVQLQRAIEGIRDDDCKAACARAAAAFDLTTLARLIGESRESIEVKAACLDALHKCNPAFIQEVIDGLAPAPQAGEQRVVDNPTQIACRAALKAAFEGAHRLIHDPGFYPLPVQAVGAPQQTWGQKIAHYRHRGAR